MQWPDSRTFQRNPTKSEMTTLTPDDVRRPHPLEPPTPPEDVPPMRQHKTLLRGTLVAALLTTAAAVTVAVTTGTASAATTWTVSGPSAGSPTNAQVTLND